MEMHERCMRVHAFLFALTGVFLLTILGFVLAQNGSVYISRFRVEPLGAQPGSTLTYHVALTNAASNTANVSLSLDVPVMGGGTVPFADAFAVSAYSTIEKTYTQTAPDPGKHVALVTVSDAGSGQVLDSAQASLAVIALTPSIPVPDTHPLLGLLVGGLALAFSLRVKGQAKR